MNWQQRSYQLELLDQPDIPFDDIRRNMHELDLINTWLGGHDITLTGIRKLAGQRKDLHICEIGCGGGDNLRAIVRKLQSPDSGRRSAGLRITGIDLKPTCIQYARERWDLPIDTEWIVSDYQKVVFDEKPDIIFSSLFCHHFTDEGVKAVFAWCAANSKLGFFMNDLHRHPLAYHAISLLTRLFSQSYLVKNDAPLSVTRGFSRRELEQFCATLDPVDFELRWKWAFRWLLVARQKNYSRNPDAHAADISR